MTMNKNNGGAMAPHGYQGGAIETALAQQAQAVVQARYAMAAARPRLAEAVRQALLHECKRPVFAAVALYEKPVGGQSITGPSIRFVETAIRIMGNIFTETVIVAETEDFRQVRCSVTDLEANATFQRDIMVVKTVERRNANNRQILGQRSNSYGKPVYIVVATDDETNVKEAAMVSKAIRTLALRLIPGDLQEEAIQLIQKTMNARDAKDPDGTRRAMLDAFSKPPIGASIDEIEAFLGKAVDRILPVDLTSMRALFGAIRDGETTWKAALEGAAEADAGEKPPEAEADADAKPKTSDLASKIASRLRTPEAAPSAAPAAATAPAPAPKPPKPVQATAPPAAAAEPAQAPAPAAAAGPATEPPPPAAAAPAPAQQELTPAPATEDPPDTAEVPRGLRLATGALISTATRPTLINAMARIHQTTPEEVDRQMKAKKVSVDTLRQRVAEGVHKHGSEITAEPETEPEADEGLGEDRLTELQKIPDEFVREQTGGKLVAELTRTQADEVIEAWANTGTA